MFDIKVLESLKLSKQLFIIEKRKYMKYLYLLIMLIFLMISTVGYGGDDTTQIEIGTSTMNIRPLLEEILKKHGGKLLQNIWSI